MYIHKKSTLHPKPYTCIVQVEAIGSIRPDISVYAFELGLAMSMYNTSLFLLAREVRGDAGMPGYLPAMAVQDRLLRRLLLTMPEANGVVTRSLLNRCVNYERCAGCN